MKHFKENMLHIFMAIYLAWVGVKLDEMDPLERRDTELLK